MLENKSKFEIKKIKFNSFLNLLNNIDILRFFDLERLFYKLIKFVVVF
jgi:hypothetical protein